MAGILAIIQTILSILSAIPAIWAGISKAGDALVPLICDQETTGASGAEKKQKAMDGLMQIVDSSAPLVGQGTVVGRLDDPGVRSVVGALLSLLIEGAVAGKNLAREFRHKSLASAPEKFTAGQ